MFIYVTLSQKCLTTMTSYVMGSYDFVHTSTWMKMENKFILLATELSFVCNFHLTEK